MVETKEKTLAERIEEIPGWYHRIVLPSGEVTLGNMPLSEEKYAVPADLTDKRVLDIGAWDGYWTWEALKRGAKEVIAIDDFSDTCGQEGVDRNYKWATFDLCREAFGFNIDLTNSDGIGSFANDKGQICRRIEMSVYDIIEEKFGRFDVVFFFGVVYHLKHPLLALEIISNICDGEIYIESAICDDASPYCKGGYPNNDMVLEFYPGSEYASNPGNWWCPTLQCLGSMVESVGFKNIQAWGHSEKPKDITECRGYVYGSKTGKENLAALNLVEAEVQPVKLSVGAVMSVPRLGFQDNMFCIFESLMPLHIPIMKVQGAFWGQCLERGIQTQIDAGLDAILTIDYDTLFKPEDVGWMIKIMKDHPEIDIIVPVHVGRSGMHALMTMKSKTGQVMTQVPREEFKKDLVKIASGHFGLTLIRTSAIMKMPHPWFLGQPNVEGQWGTGRIDDDIYFWKQAEKAGLNVYAANRIVVGHLELTATWPDINLIPIHQSTIDYQDNGKPKNVWK